MKTNYQIIYCFYREKVFVCLKGEVGSGWHRKKNKAPQNKLDIIENTVDSGQANVD